MKQGTTTLPLIEAKCEGQPAGGVPPKGVSQSRSMTCACQGGDRTRPEQQKTRQAVELAGLVGLKGLRLGLKPEYLVVIGGLEPPTSAL
jgi:hypothetical protein